MRTFESFVPGESLGEVTLPPPLESWRHLFPRQAEYEHAPTGFLVAVMMRGYIAIIGKRPDGNVHLDQKLRWGSPAPRDTSFVVSLRCVDKQIRKDRRHVWLVASVGDGRELSFLDGDMQFLWAA